MYKQMYNVGIYLRISKDDEDTDESESITNQRKIIKEYLSRKDDCIIIDEYIDDGFSGANFNRPSFKRLLKDIENKKINMVIVKNLARFGRNYIDSGDYIEKYFPNNGVRFIAVLDNFDNFVDSVQSDFLPLISVFNEKHCKDTSTAVKRSKRKRMKEGVYACNTPPFGYKKDPENLTHLIVDESSSKVVKKIFELKENGLTIKEIADFLNKHKYTTPACYSENKSFKLLENADIWKSSSVCRILSNRVYLGECVRGKTQNISYKSKKRININRDECIVTLHTHEPLISEETFNNVHNFNRYGKKQNKNNDEFILKDFLFCAKCKKKCYIRMGRNNAVIYCSQNEKSKYICDNDNIISYNWLEKEIMSRLKKMMKNYISKTTVDEALKQKIENNISIYKMEKKNTESKLTKVNQKIYNLYNSKLNGKNEDLYLKEYDLLNTERNQLKKEIKYIEEMKNNEYDKYKNEIDRGKVIELLESLMTDEENNYMIAHELIDRIEINQNSILVKYKFTGAYNRLCMSKLLRV